MVLGGHYHPANKFLGWYVNDVEAVLGCDCDEHRVPVRRNRIGPGPSLDRDVGREFHLLEIDDIDLMSPHRTYKDVAIAAQIKSIVRLLNRQRFDTFLLRHVDDLDVIFVANRNSYIFSVARGSALIGTAGETYRTQDGPSCSIYDAKRVVRFDRHEQLLPIGRHADAMDMVTYLNVSNNIQRFHVDDADVVATTVADVKNEFLSGRIISLETHDTREQHPYQQIKY